MIRDILRPIMANKRSYRSPRREAQAEQTRALVLGSARALFTGRGYAGTTIEAVAADAGVSPQTIYTAYRSKRGLLLALLDQMAVDADAPQSLPATEGDP